MLYRYTPGKGIIMLYVCTLLTSATFSNKARAQLFEAPWGFQPQNRASIAALMRQEENRDNVSSQAVVSEPASVTNLVCGSDGTSSAQGNSTCVILNYATGNLEIGQDAEGSQTATSTAEQTQNIENGNSLAEALGDLDGGGQ